MILVRALSELKFLDTVSTKSEWSPSHTLRHASAAVASNPPLLPPGDVSEVVKSCSVARINVLRLSEATGVSEREAS